MIDFLEILKHTGYGDLVVKSIWGYAIFEIIHLVGIVMLVGAITLTDLRLLGWSRALPVTYTSEYLLRWVWLGFGLCVFAGSSLFISDGRMFLKNPFFLSKMILIVLTGINAAFFQFRVFRNVAQWEQGVSSPMIAKVCAALSMTLWFTAIAAGKLIAYPTLWSK